jgi:hypothetical protein
VGLFRRKSRDEEPRPLIDPAPLRTPDDAFETGFLIGALRNTWQAIAVKNLRDRRIATGEADDTRAWSGQPVTSPVIELAKSSAPPRTR